ncbi:RNase H family protein [Flavitalea flava]
MRIYTDGSCHTQLGKGAWVAILLTGEDKVVLSGVVEDTTHNRMEVLAVIRAIQHIKINYPFISHLKIGSDSQYVVGLPGRARKLSASGFANKKGVELQNADLVKEFLDLTGAFLIEWIKIKAHSQNSGSHGSDKESEAVYRESEGIRYNREADILSRKLVRELVAK